MPTEDPIPETLQISVAQLAALFDLIYPTPDGDNCSCQGGPVSGRRPQPGPRYARELVNRALRAADAYLALNPDTDDAVYGEVAARVFAGPRAAEQIP